jgi:ribonuclease HI/single-stranded DNA-binding protein
MADQNVVVLTGKLTEDPVLYADPEDGGDVTILHLAVVGPKRSGGQASAPDLFEIVVRNRDAKAVAQYLAKGCRAGVTGRLHQLTWTTADGSRSRVQVIAGPGQVLFIDVKDRGEQTATPVARPADDVPGTPEEAPATSTPAPEPETPPAPQGGSEVVVWADGASRGNPGAAGYGSLITTMDGEVLAELREGIGWATNNVAEYRGVIAGLRQAKTLGARRVHLRADAKLVIQQLKGTNRVKSQALVPLHTEALQLAAEFEAVTFKHVAREANQAADRLASQAIDAQGPVTDPGAAESAAGVGAVPSTPTPGQ